MSDKPEESTRRCLTLRELTDPDRRPLSTVEDLRNYLTEHSLRETVEAEDGLHYGAIERFADFGRLDMVKAAVEMDTENGSNTDAFILAAWSGKYDVVVYLADKNVDIHADEDGAFRRAAEYGHLRVVKYLVEVHKADIHAVEDSALRRSTLNNHFDVVQYLVERGANVQSSDHWPIRTAAENRNLEMVQYFIKHGAVFPKDFNVPAEVRDDPRVQQLLIASTYLEDNGVARDSEEFKKLMHVRGWPELVENGFTPSVDEIRRLANSENHVSRSAVL